MWHTSKPRRQLVWRNNSGKILLKQLCQRNCKKLKKERRFSQTLGDSHQSQTPPPPKPFLKQSRAQSGREISSRKLWLSLILMNQFSRVVSFNSLQTLSKGLLLFMRNRSTRGNSFLTLFPPELLRHFPFVNCGYFSCMQYAAPTIPNVNGLIFCFFFLVRWMFVVCIRFSLLWTRF